MHAIFEFYVKSSDTFGNIVGCEQLFAKDSSLIIYYDIYYAFYYDTIFYDLCVFRPIINGVLFKGYAVNSNKYIKQSNHNKMYGNWQQANYNATITEETPKQAKQICK